MAARLGPAQRRGRRSSRREPPRGALLGSGPARATPCLHRMLAARYGPAHRSASCSFDRRGCQSAELRPCTCEGKTTQTPWSLPRTLPGLAPVQGAARLIAVARGTAGDILKRCCWTPLRAGGGSVCRGAVAGHRLALDPTASEGPSKRSRPHIFRNNARVSLVLPSWARMRCRWVARRLRSTRPLPPCPRSSRRRSWHPALAPRRGAEGGVRGGNHRVVPSSVWAGARNALSTADARGPSWTVAPISAPLG